MHVTFTLQLAIWMLICAPGFFLKAWIVHRSYRRLMAMERLGSDADLIDSTKHVLTNQFHRLMSWAAFLTIGLVAVFFSDTPPADAPVGISDVGKIIVVLLIVAVGFLAAQTWGDFLYILKMDARARDSVRGQGTRAASDLPGSPLNYSLDPVQPADGGPLLDTLDPPVGTGHATALPRTGPEYLPLVPEITTEPPPPPAPPGGGSEHKVD